MRPGFRDIIRQMQSRTSRTQGVVLNTEDLNLSETGAWGMAHVPSFFTVIQAWA